MSNVHWLSRGRTWHAWEHGSRVSKCGRLNVEHLNRKPPDDIVTQLQPEHVANACRTCVRKSNGVGVPAIKSNGDAASAWLGYLLRHARRVHARPGVNNLRTLSKLLAEIGPPTNNEAQEIYHHVRDLLIVPGGAPAIGLRAALEKMPPGSGALARAAESMRAWRRVTEQSDLLRGRFRADRVIDVMLQVPDPEPYLRHLKSRGIEHIGAAFHPNTLARAKREPELRGLFGTGHAYGQRMRDRVVVKR